MYVLFPGFGFLDLCTKDEQILRWKVFVQFQSWNFGEWAGIMKEKWREREREREADLPHSVLADSP